MELDAHEFDWDECFRIALKENMTGPDLARILGVLPVTVANKAIKCGVELRKGMPGFKPINYIERGLGSAIMLRRKAEAAGFMNVRHKDGSSSGRNSDGSYIPTVQKYTDAPASPKLNEKGAYCPEDLLRFLRECEKQAVRVDQIAAILRVPVHRVVYFYADGMAALKRRAGLAA